MAATRWSMRGSFSSNILIPEGNSPKADEPLTPVALDESGYISKTQYLLKELSTFPEIKDKQYELFLKELAFLPALAQQQARWKTPYKIVKAAGDCDGAQTIAKIFKSLTTTHDLSESSNQGMVIWTLRLIVNLSSLDGVPTPFADLLCEQETHIIILQLLNPIKTDLDKDKEQDCEVIKDGMNALYALSRSSVNKTKIHKSSGVSILTPYLNSDDVFLQARSLLILANIVDETEGERIDDEYGTIKLIINFIYEALTNEETKFIWKQGNLKYFFYLRDLLVGLDRLSVIDTNKSRIIEAAGLSALSEILEKGNPDNQLLAAKIVWNLTFDPKCQQAIRESPLLPVLEKYCYHGNKDVRVKVKGALWKLTDQVSIDKPERSDHVMISYCWSQKHLVQNLNKALWARGYDIWMDVEQMTGKQFK